MRAGDINAYLKSFVVYFISCSRIANGGKELYNVLVYIYCVKGYLFDKRDTMSLN